MKKSAQYATVIAASALALVAAGCSSSSTSSPSSSPASGSPTVASKTLTANGVTFQYPAEWEQRTDLTTSAQKGNQLWQEAVGPTENQLSLAILNSYDFGAEVTEANVSQLESKIATTLSDLASQAGGSVTSAPKLEPTAGLPGFTAQISSTTQSGASVNSTVWLFFNGKVEFFLNCQYANGDEPAMLTGCNMMRSTLKPAS